MNAFLPSGTLSTGANYWASHAGIHMWRDWRPEVIDADFTRLSGLGLDVLRVFPLWPDFQPIHSLQKWRGLFVEHRHGELPLGADDADVGEDGVSREMLRRFGVLADLAHKHGISLIVGLITGWMSGRHFVPPALEHLNPVTDASSIQWQVRLIRALVVHHRDQPAIRAWDLGNECNCLGPATREQAWLWTATLANTIRASDATRPVISGMHSLKVDPAGPWSIRDQGELTDMLTTHPYALFTPHCDREPLNTMRPLLHAAAETCLYADLSGKPAIVEEFGTLGPMICGDDAAAAMARVRIFDAWTHDARAALWWCAHDQTHLDYAPYDWLPLERELGLLREDGSPKPAALAFKETRAAIASLPEKTLPPRRIDAVCLLTQGQDQWGAAYTAFILAKQAGFDLRFHYCDRSLPEADLYLMPSVKDHTPLPRRIEKQLWAKVAAGATLYLSLDDCTLGDYVANTGVKIATRARRTAPCRFAFANANFEIITPVAYDFTLPPSAEVFAREADGHPVFFKTTHGRGAIYSLLAPLETVLANQNGAFLPGTVLPFWRFYTTIAETALAQRIVRKESPWLGVTEHAHADGTVTVIIVNYADREITDHLRLLPGCVFSTALLGPAPEIAAASLTLKLSAATAAVWTLSS
ncbi:MAG: hypothetical protein WC205_02635 [Opitutaceae bacterium]|jgi:hypothetical protein